MIRIARRAAVATALLAVPVFGFPSLVGTSASAVTLTGTPAATVTDGVLEGFGAVDGVTTFVVQATAASTPVSYAAPARHHKKAKVKATARKRKSKKASKPSTTAPTTATSSAYASLESQIITLTNQQRTAHGCGALRTESKLTTAARRHSADMVKYNFFSHTGSDGSTFTVRAARAGYSAASAENIAWGWPTAKVVVDQWMNSAGHRANILNCSYKAVGVGVAKKADGTPYYTQDFGRA